MSWNELIFKLRRKNRCLTFALVIALKPPKCHRNIENVCSGAQLDVQHIAYDVTLERVGMVGNEWISKIKSKDCCLTLVSSSCFAAVPSVSKALKIQAQQRTMMSNVLLVMSLGSDLDCYEMNQFSSPGANLVV